MSQTLTYFRPHLDPKTLPTHTNGLNRMRLSCNPEVCGHFGLEAALRRCGSTVAAKSSQTEPPKGPLPAQSRHGISTTRGGCSERPKADINGIFGSYDSAPPKPILLHEKPLCSVSFHKQGALIFLLVSPSNKATCFLPLRHFDDFIVSNPSSF